MSIYLESIKSMRRKLIKSIQQRGVVRTCLRCAAQPVRRFATVAQWVDPRFRQLRRQHAVWDATHNVQTAPADQADWIADITSQNWASGRGYHPAPAASLSQRLANLQVDFEQFTFIDFGSGKGRSLFAASDFPFKKIVGVEFNHALHTVATQNVATYRNETQRCFEIQPVLADATEFEIPPSSNIYYFYDPFGEPVFGTVVSSVIERLRQDKLPCYVIYFNPVFAEYFEDSPLFERIEYGSEFLPYWQRTLKGNKDANEYLSELKDDERYVVYRSRIA